MPLHHPKPEAEEDDATRHLAKRLRELADRIDPDVCSTKPLKVVRVGVMSEQLTFKTLGYLLTWPLPDERFELTVECYHPHVPSEPEAEAKSS